MASEPGHDKAPSRKDESWRLWAALVEQAARNDELGRRLEAIESSQSWRVTAPLRAIRRWFGVKQSAPTALCPAAPFDAEQQGADRIAADRMLVDVTELSIEDLGAGVQRVTRRLLQELLAAPPAAVEIVPVRLAAGGGYCLARGFLAQLEGAEPGARGADVAVNPRRGDRLIGLDFCRDRSDALADALASIRNAGGTSSLIVHDVLPLTHPQWFPDAVSAAFERWLKVLSQYADRAICNSAVTAAELRLALEARALQIPRGGIGVIPLGSDLLPAPSARVLPPRATGTWRVLTVGTIEPRKGYPQILEALELLWARGENVEWILAGREGWHMAEFIQRLRAHPQKGRALHWIEGPDDRELQSIYKSCDQLVMASHGEGYGLPIAEAGRLGLRLLLRDLPVFREVAGPAAEYFSGERASDLATAIERSAAAHEPAVARGWPTWSDSAEALKNLVA